MIDTVVARAFAPEDDDSEDEEEDDIKPRRRRRTDGFFGVKIDEDSDGSQAGEDYDDTEIYTAQKRARVKVSDGCLGLPMQ